MVDKKKASYEWDRAYVKFHRDHYRVGHRKDILSFYCTRVCTSCNNNATNTFDCLLVKIKHLDIQI